MKKNLVKALIFAATLSTGSNVQAATVDISAGASSAVSQNAIRTSIDLHAGVSQTLSDYLENPVVEGNELEVVGDSIKAETYYVKSENGINLRKKNNKTSEVVKVIGYGQKVDVIEYDKDDRSKVVYKNKVGYVATEYLTKKKPKKLKKATTTTATGSQTSKSNMIKVSSTAYYDKYGTNSTADGTAPYYGVLAGKREWLGRSCQLYACNADGSVGKLIGSFTFHDTGYGASTGYGSSRILKGRCVGTIENGSCIDIFMRTYAECARYGRKNVYIKFL